jgi:hypothetical protein
MSVNGFSHEDEVRAAYDAAERVLYHALDTDIIRIDQVGSTTETVARLAVRIVDAVMHSSEQDITELFPSVVQAEEAQAT